MLKLDSDQIFAEPVALSSTQPVDRPLARRALRLGLDLVALRARRTREPKRSSCEGQMASSAFAGLAAKTRLPVESPAGTYFGAGGSVPSLMSRLSLSRRTIELPRAHRLGAAV